MERLLSLRLRRGAACGGRAFLNAQTRPATEAADPFPSVAASREPTDPGRSSSETAAGRSNRRPPDPRKRSGPVLARTMAWPPDSRDARDAGGRRVAPVPDQAVAAGDRELPERPAALPAPSVSVTTKRPQAREGSRTLQ